MLRVGEIPEKMEVIYVSGSIRAPTEYEVSLNVEHARQISAEVWKLGHVPICPHTNGYNMAGIVPIRQFLRGDLLLVQRSDSILMLEGWKDSKGAQLEHEFAVEEGKVVYYHLKDIPNVI